MAWGNTDWVTTGVDRSKRVLHDGALSVSQTVTRTEYVLNFSEEQSFRPSTSYIANNATPTGSNTWQVTRSVNIRAVCDIVTVTAEYRGAAGEYAGTAATADSKDTSIGIDAYDSGFVETYWDHKTWKGYRVTAPAVSAELKFPECQGTQRSFSARRANEAGGWVTVRTESTLNTTISRY